MGIRVQSGIAEEQTQIQIGNAGITAENHAPDIHQHHTGQIKQVKSKRAPDIFHGPAQRIVTQQGNGGKHQRVGAVGQWIGKQAPHLTLEDSGPVKVQKVVQKIVAGNVAHKVHDGSTQNDIKHQIGDTFVAILVTEQLEAFSQVFQWVQLLTHIL